jgi:hypothetical protein
MILVSLADRLQNILDCSNYPLAVETSSLVFCPILNSDCNAFLCPIYIHFRLNSEHLGYVRKPIVHHFMQKKNICERFGQSK